MYYKACIGEKNLAPDVCVCVEFDVGCFMVLCWSFSRGWHQHLVYIWYVQVPFVGSYHTSPKAKDRNMRQTEPSAEFALPSNTAIIHRRVTGALNIEVFPTIRSRWDHFCARSCWKHLYKEEPSPSPTARADSPGVSGLAFGRANFNFYCGWVVVITVYFQLVFDTCSFLWKCWYSNFKPVLLLYNLHQFSVYERVVRVWFIEFSSHHPRAVRTTRTTDIVLQYFKQGGCWA